MSIAWGMVRGERIYALTGKIVLIPGEEDRRWLFKTVVKIRFQVEFVSHKTKRYENNG